VRSILKIGLVFVFLIQVILVDPFPYGSTQAAEVSPPSTLKADTVSPSKPLWSVKVDGTAATGFFNGARTVVNPFAGLAITLKGGQMVAIRTRTGEQAWKFGANLLPYFIMDYDSIYAFTKGGMLVSVTLRGKKKWAVPSGKLSSEDRIFLLDKLYVFRHGSIQAYSKTSGKLIWKSIVPMSSSIPLNLILSDNELIGTRTVDGALTTVQLFAYDNKTGKELWFKDRQFMPYYFGPEGLYTQEEEIPFPLDVEERQVTVNIIDYRSGEVLSTKQYRHKPSFKDSNAMVTTPLIYKWDMSSTTSYLFWGDVIAEYDLLDDSTNPQPLRSYAQPANTYFTGLFKYKQFIMQDDQRGRMSAIRIATGIPLIWDDDQTPRYSADILDRGVYEKFQNGDLKAYDLRNGQLAFSAKTGPGNITQVLRTGPFLIIEKDGLLLGYPTPEQLQ
jgi:outer membrane protein assembly factor BamB